MIDVVFNDSACGSLKLAQHFGQGEYQSGAISVVISSPDGSEPTDEEIQSEQQEAEENDRFEWEHAVPMGGDPADIYGFDFDLSIGDISESVPGEKRLQVLKWLSEIHPYFEEAEPDFFVEHMQEAKSDLEEVCRRILTGEDVRIWYSNHPEELCGLHWFMTQLNEIEPHDGQIFLVPLPDWEIDEDGDIIYRSIWDGIKPGEWHRYLDLQKAAPSAFCMDCAARWKHLQQENAPLRVLLNGRLVSASVTFYDEFICREITAADDEFDETMLIGTIMEKYDLKDTLIAQRVESMICAGSLVPVTEPAHDCPVYHRRLKKVP